LEELKHITDVQVCVWEEEMNTVDVVWDVVKIVCYMGGACCIGTCLGFAIDHFLDYFTPKRRN